MRYMASLAIVLGVVVLVSPAQAQVDCSQVDDVKVAPNAGVGKVKVVIKSELPGGTAFTVEQTLPDGSIESVGIILRAGGKGRAFLRTVVTGGNTVRVVECPDVSACYAVCDTGDGEFSECGESCLDGDVATCACQDDGSASCHCEHP